jgi:O-antigen ligase
MYTEFIQVPMFIIWLASFPFILLYGAYEGPKVFWLWIGGFFLTLSWIFQLTKSPSISINRESMWFAAWVVILACASFLGIHPLDSFVGGSYRHQGVLFFFTIFLIIETIQKISVKQKQLLVKLLVAGVFVESVIVLAQKYLYFSSRPLGTFGEPNAVAGYLAIGLVWILTVPMRSLYKLLLYTGVLVAITATGSRTGMASVAVLSVGIGVCFLLKYKKHVLQKISIVLGCILVVLFSFFFIQFITRTRAPSIYEDRMLFWQLGLKEFIKRPLLGYGAESGEAIYDGAFQSINVRLVDFMVDRSHNLFLDVALWSGIVGLIIFIGWLIVCLGKFIKLHQYLRICVLAAWIVFASFQPLGVVHWIQLILLVSV